MTTNTDFSHTQPQIAKNIKSVAIETGVPSMEAYFRWLRLTNYIRYKQSITPKAA